MPIIITFKVNLYFIIMRLDFCLSLFTKGSTWAFFSLLVVLEFFLKLGKYLYYFWNIPLFTVKIMIMAFHNFINYGKIIFHLLYRSPPPAALPCWVPEPREPCEGGSAHTHLRHTEAGHPQQACGLTLVAGRPQYRNFKKRRKEKVCFTYEYGFYYTININFVLHPYSENA